MNASGGCDLIYEYVQKEEGNNSPGSKVDGDGINLLGGVGRGSIGSTDTRARNQEGSKGNPERAVRCERCFFFLEIT